MNFKCTLTLVLLRQDQDSGGIIKFNNLLADHCTYCVYLPRPSIVMLHRNYFHILSINGYSMGRREYILKSHLRNFFMYSEFLRRKSPSCGNTNHRKQFLERSSSSDQKTFDLIFLKLKMGYVNTSILSMQSLQHKRLFTHIR